MHPGEGFVKAEKLPAAVLSALGGVPTWKIKRSKAKKGEAVLESRIGGQPNIAQGRWPMDDDEPMAFLCQVRVPKGLPEGYSGVAVFIVTNGTCTEESSNNRVLLLTEAELTGPAATPLDGLPKSGLPHNLEVGKEKLVVDRDRVAAWTAADGIIASRFDEMNSDMPFDFVGGIPMWQQGVGYGDDGETEGPYALLFQLGFMESSPPKGFEDFGIAGALYVFTDGAGKPHALWQYD